MKFTIDRSKWRAGGTGDHACGKGQVYLQNRENFQCCLGQISMQLGIPEDALLYKTNPRWISNKNEQIVSIFLKTSYNYGLNQLTIDAININDNIHYTSSERETKLTELFAKNGYELEFTGEYTPYRSCLTACN